VGALEQGCDLWNAYRGLPSGEKEDILLRYATGIPKCLRPPSLNQEVHVHLQEHYRNRDKAASDRQASVGGALAALGAALFSAEDDVSREDLLSSLADAGKLLTDLMHEQSMDSRAVILPRVTDKTAREVMATSIPDSLLFGTDLPDRLKSSKAVANVGKDIFAAPMVTSSSRLRLTSGNGRGPQRFSTRNTHPLRATKGDPSIKGQRPRQGRWDPRPRGRNFH